MIRTKEIIRNTFWDILEEKPYNKITVQDIVDRCQVNRNTFYYYFQDIPTLMTDSVEEWMEEVIQKYGNFTSPVDCLTYMAEECMKRKKAFLHLFRSVQKDRFLSGLNQMGYDIIRSYVDKVGEHRKMVIVFSMLLGIAAVLFLALTGETYATALAFLLLVLKAGLYMKGR